jgi:hypothetical protein
MQLVQLSPDHHAGLRINPDRARAHAATVHLIPIVRSEMRKAASTYPVFFAKDGDTGQFYLAALMGLEPHENLHWNGSDLPAYVPLNILRQPFCVGADDDGGGVICIDGDSAAIDPDGSCAITGPDGKETAYFGTIQAILSELAGQQNATRGFIDRALALNLVTEIKLDVTFDDGTAVSLTGLYGIDERALARHAGSMTDFEEVIGFVAMILSLDHVADLVRRKNAILSGAATWLGRAA